MRMALHCVSGPSHPPPLPVLAGAERPKFYHSNDLPLQHPEAGLPAGISQPVVHEVFPNNGGLQVQPQRQRMQLDPWKLVIKPCPIRGEPEPSAETQDSMRMNAEDVVASGVKLCRLDQLGWEVGGHALPDKPPATYAWVGDFYLPGLLCTPVYMLDAP